MPRFVLLVNATRQGVEKRKGSVARIEENKKSLKAAGIDVRANYHTLGPHDGFMIVEAPNGTAVAKAIYRMEAAGNIPNRNAPPFHRRRIQGDGCRSTLIASSSHSTNTRKLLGKAPLHLPLIFLSGSKRPRREARGAFIVSPLPNKHFVRYRDGVPLKPAGGWVQINNRKPCCQLGYEA
jgi:uncharacterized protein with GYD domain